MRILVTGGAGFVGTQLIHLLLNKGISVTCLDILLYGGRHLAPFLEHPGFSFIQGSVTDFRLVEQAADNCDAIIHLAGYVGYPLCNRYPDISREVNIQGTENIVEVAQEKPVIFASTGSIYGHVDPGIDKVTENHPAEPVSTYGLHKLKAEEAIRNRCSNYVIFRFATGYGSSYRTRYDLLVNDLLYSAMTKRELVIYESEFKRSFIHVSEMAYYLWLATVKSLDYLSGAILHSQGTFNCGFDRGNLTKKQLVELIQEIVSPLDVHYVGEGKDLDQRNYNMDYSRLHHVFASPLGAKSIKQHLVELHKTLKVLGTPHLEAFNVF